MASELDTQAMKKIFADTATLESFRVFGNLWDKRHHVIGNTFKEYFQDELGFSVHSEFDNNVFKEIGDGMSIGFNTELSFGFVKTPDGEQFSPSNKELFKKLLGELLENKKYFTDGEIYDDDDWVCCTMDYNKISCLNDLKNMVEELERIILNEKT